MFVNLNMLPNFSKAMCKSLFAEQASSILSRRCRYMSKKACSKVATLAKKRGMTITPLDLTDLTNPCKMQKGENRKKSTGNSEGSMWEKLPKKEEEPQRMLRYDEIHCKPSCKDRLYQQTWNDCPEELIRMRKVCCLEPIPVKYEKRCLPKRSKSMTRQCDRKAAIKCPKITMPGCRPSKAVTCRVQPMRTDCLKVLAPYPSFSECLRDRPTLIRSECRCWKDISICDVNDVLRRLKIRDLH